MTHLKFIYIIISELRKFRNYTLENSKSFLIVIEINKRAMFLDKLINKIFFFFQKMVEKLEKYSPEAIFFFRAKPRTS